MIETKQASYEEFLIEGKQYLKTATNGASKPEKFSADILYNIISMSIEKFIMAYLVKCKNLPFNHTLQDLLEGLKVVTSVDKELEDRLMHLNGFQEICTINYAERKIPSNDEISYMISTGNMVAEFIDKKLEEL
jgi:hypothetical protein